MEDGGFLWCDNSGSHSLSLSLSLVPVPPIQKALEGKKEGRRTLDVNKIHPSCELAPGIPTSSSLTTASARPQVGTFPQPGKDGKGRGQFVSRVRMGTILP